MPQTPPMADAAAVSGLEADVAEFEALAARAERPAVKAGVEQLLRQHRQKLEQARKAASAPPPAEKKEAAGAAAAAPPAGGGDGVQYSTLSSFMFDAGQYNSPTVTVYVPIPGVGAAKDRVTCEFTKESFDLIVRDLGGKSWRFGKDNLEKEIVPESSKYIVKADKVVVKLAKKKGEYGSYDYWSDLCAKRQKDPAKKEDPSAGIMDMMRDMYNDGDDNMKKVIGEAMMKSQRGEKPDTKFDDPLDDGKDSF